MCHTYNEVSTVVIPIVQIIKLMLRNFKDRDVK